MPDEETYCVLIQRPVDKDNKTDNAWMLAAYSWPSAFIAPKLSIPNSYAAKEEAILAGVAKYGKIWRVNPLYSSIWSADWHMKLVDSAAEWEIDAANAAWRDFVNRLEEIEV